MENKRFINTKKQIERKEAEIAALKEQMNSFDYTEIKTFEDACENQGEDPNHPKFKYVENTEDEGVDNSGPAFERLKVIRNAILGSKKLIWRKNQPFNYFPWFNMTKKPGSGFGDSAYNFWPAGSAISSRLALVSEEEAFYFGSQFESDWYEYMVEHKF